MNKTLRLLILAVITATAMPLLGGCAMSSADREFYGAHWMHPTELDRESAPPTTNGMPNNPVDY